MKDDDLEVVTITVRKGIDLSPARQADANVIKRLHRELSRTLSEQAQVMSFCILNGLDPDDEQTRRLIKTEMISRGIIQKSC